MLKFFAEYVTSSLIGLEHGSHLADAVEFFIYDTIKIFFLLSIIIFAISIIRSYFPPEKTKKILSHKKELIQQANESKMLKEYYKKTYIQILLPRNLEESVAGGKCYG